MHTFTINRRHPAAALAVLLLGLLSTGMLYAVVDGNTSPARGAVASETQIQQGKALFAEGCATCHGTSGQGTTDGPNLVGIGAAAVHFQVSTGRMPMASSGNIQSHRRPSQYSEEETAALAAFVASLGEGPAIPTAEQLAWENADLAVGGEIFRTNCSQCHSFSGQGGALTQGKYAPNLMKATPQQIYEAMLTGPNNMPRFSDETLPAKDKQAVIKYIESLKEPKNPGGLDLGRLGPVGEGLFGWVFGIGALILVAIWIGVKAK